MDSKCFEKCGVIILLIVSFSFSSCEDTVISPSSTITTSEITVGDFDGVSVSNAFDVEVFQVEVGEEYVLIESNENIHQYVMAYQEEGNLIIRLDGVNISGGNTVLKARVYTSTSISSIEASGASRVTVMDAVFGEEVSLMLSGASFLRATINSESIDAVIQGASNVEIEGYTNRINLDISGASRMQDESMTTDIANIELSGASSATLVINQEIWLNATGASLLKYDGDASIKEILLSGASTIEKL